MIKEIFYKGFIVENDMESKLFRLRNTFFPSYSCFSFNTSERNSFLVQVAPRVKKRTDSAEQVAQSGRSFQIRRLLRPSDGRSGYAREIQSWSPLEIDARVSATDRGQRHKENEHPIWNLPPRGGARSGRENDARRNDCAIRSESRLRLGPRRSIGALSLKLPMRLACEKQRRAARCRPMPSGKITR